MSVFNNSSNLLEETILPIVSSIESKVDISFEFFPPKTEKMNEKLWDCIDRLKNLNPKFVSVTYGAGGSTRERTHETVLRIKNETNIQPAAHLTCIGASKKEIHEIAENYWKAGIKHIVALRGDIPEGMTKEDVLKADGYIYANELVKGLKDIADFEISVAAYPEKHPEASSLDKDIDNLKRKVDAGATRAITQFFVDVDAYKRFLEKARKAGIKIPIVPGILPITNFKRTVDFANMTGTKIPDWAYKLFEGLDEDVETRKLVAATLAIEQCRVLQSFGVDSFHIYTLNRADLAYAISHVLGIREKK